MKQKEIEQKLGSDVLEELQVPLEITYLLRSNTYYIIQYIKMFIKFSNFQFFE